MKRTYRFLLFDLDDTLFDFHKAEGVALAAVCEEYGVKMDEERKCQYQEVNKALWDQFASGAITKRTVVDTRFQIVFDAWGLLLDGKAFNKAYAAHLADYAYVVENAEEVCRQPSQTHALYALTNGVSKTQYARLTKSGLASFFKQVFVSEDIGHQKPSLEYFTAVFAQIPDFQKEQALMIGDMLSTDIIGGIRAGIDTCWFNPKQVNDSGKLPITYNISHLNELVELL